MEAVIRLFKGVPIKTKGKGKANKALLKLTIEKGFIFSPEVLFNFSEHQLLELQVKVVKEFGLTGRQMNSSLHKSWKKVKEASIEQLVVEQIIHYITTYGYEALGIYDESTVYIPAEKLTIPKIDLDKIPLVIIKGYTEQELKSKLVNFLSLGVALKEDTKKDVIDVALSLKFTEDEVLAVKNKEVKISLFDYLGLIPKSPVEFLRYMIYKSTNRTLIIKNRGTIAEIKTKDNLAVLALLNKYERKYGLGNLASIFYRFKPLFLAFRTNSNLKAVINKIRRLASTYHEPMQEDLLNNITNRISNGTIKMKEVKEALSRVNTFRKIRLAYALKFRTAKRESIMYRIRNGKSYATNFSYTKIEEAKKVLKVVLGSIAEDVAVNVKGKKIYVPENINYTLPATEKQFTGDIPSGSYVIVPKNLLVGVHWENLSGSRVDLDLSMMNANVGKLGWDGYYRSNFGSILFSGDVVDAPKPNGASEFFYISEQANNSYLLMLNHFTHAYVTGEVPFKIIIASEAVNKLDKNHIVNPNNVVYIAKSVISDKQKTLGLIVTTPEENRFYFAEATLGDSISSYNANYTEHSRRYLLDYYQNGIELKDLLEEAGAKIVKNSEKCDIDLSLENIQRDTILNLFRKEELPVQTKQKTNNRIDKKVKNIVR